MVSILNAEKYCKFVDIVVVFNDDCCRIVSRKLFTTTTMTFREYFKYIRNTLHKTYSSLIKIIVMDPLR